MGISKVMGGIPKLAGEYFVEHPELTKMNDF